MNIRKNVFIIILLCDIAIISGIYYWGVKTTYRELFKTELKHVEYSISDYESNYRRDSISINYQLKHQGTKFFDSISFEYDTKSLEYNANKVQELKAKKDNLEKRNQEIENQFISWELIKIHASNKINKYKRFFEI